MGQLEDITLLCSDYASSKMFCYYL